MTTPVPDLDVLVVGSGVAGLSAVVRLAMVPGMRVGVLSKANLSQSATRWAQGGIAAVLGGDEDSTDLHLADTLAAGAGLCDPVAVRVLVDEGPLRLRELIALGAVFDRDARGELARAREGGHSTARVLHAGGAATGAEVERALLDAVCSTAAAVLERWHALDLVVSSGRCRGVRAVDATGTLSTVHARHVVLATGGAGQLFAVTTNPTEATGDGIAMALRAGVPVADVELFQFHPTALHHPAVPRPLLSEALRGHGALIRDRDGERFVDELAPRDVVSRAMAKRMADQGVAHMWLDATGLESFDERFPTLAASLAKAGLDPSCDWLPIAPAAHHLSGGILTDLDGASTLPGLWAAGETACTGVHGANRLASNSLLEGMVFGARVAEAIENGREGPRATGALAGLGDRAGRGDQAQAHIPLVPIYEVPSEVEIPRPLAFGPGEPCAGDEALELVDWPKLRDRLQRAMIEGAGVLRSPQSLRRAASEVDAVASALASVRVSAHGPSVASTHAAAGSRVAAAIAENGWEVCELANLVDVSRALLRAAGARAETRGAHARIDYPDPRPQWRCRLVHGVMPASVPLA